MKHLQDVKTPLELGTRLGWSQEGLRKMLREALSGRERGWVIFLPRCAASVLTTVDTLYSVRNIASCYTRGEPFSLDLGSAVRPDPALLLLISLNAFVDTGPSPRNLHRQDARPRLDAPRPVRCGRHAAPALRRAVPRFSRPHGELSVVVLCPDARHCAS